MNNKVVYFDEKVPEYYLNGSRDFQVLVRLLTLIVNSAKVEADSLLYLNDPILISNNLLQLFKTKVGFFTNRTFKDDEIRVVCDCFCKLVLDKGSRDGIVKAIELYMKAIGISSTFDILIYNKDADGNNLYTIDIGINYLQKDYTLLQEILRYIIPTGYIFNIFFYDYLQIKQRFLQYSDYVVTQESNTNVINGDYNSSSKVLNSYYSTITSQWSENNDFSFITDFENTIQSIDITTIGKGIETENE